MRFILRIILLFCASHLVLGDYFEPYTVPEAKIEVFRPRGLRVSIPDYPDIRIFAVHIAVNRELNGLEAGDISRDILKKTGNRWVFEDRKIKLNYGDVLNYWLFVIKGHLGFRLDDQSYVVKTFQEAPPHFHNGISPQGITTATPPGGDSAQEIYVPLRPCSCPSVTKEPPCSFPSSTEPPSAPNQAADIAIWRELLVNISTENAQFRQQVATLYENNQLLVGKLERLGDENLKKLRLEGKVLKDEDPLSIAKTVLTENLRILDTSIVRKAVRNDDGTITFELRTIDDKLMILREVKDKLKGAKFSIKDIDAISFADNDGKLIIDLRSQ